MTDTQLRKILQKSVTASKDRKWGYSELSIDRASRVVIDLNEEAELQVTAENRRRFCKQEQIAIGRPDRTTAARDNACWSAFQAKIYGLRFSHSREVSINQK